MELIKQQNDSINLLDKLNYFTLFNLPISFEINKAQLEQFFLQTLSQTHPDRFVNSSKELKEAAMKNSAIINKAYRVLKSDYTRLGYLLNQLDINADNAQIDDEDFLEESFILRDNIATISDVFTLKKILNEIENECYNYYSKITTMLTEKLYSEVIQVYIKLKFLHKMTEELNQMIEFREIENEII